ncbi:MAG: phosphoribosylamine--glycine ligase [Anaerolineales bacterium]|nr:phosphoribosylamine--glycine ligase [Anaerolineales bacterium]
MNVLIIGSGGREHAMAWKVAQSPRLTKLYIAPGNAGTGDCGENVLLDVTSHVEVVRFCREKQIDLVLIGPEIPLADGLADSLSAERIRCFGPSQAAAQIEASKSFAKDFMARHHIPTARYATFDKVRDVIDYLESVDYPVVIKASGLAAGKGVILPETLDEAKAVVESILVDKTFGEAGSEVIIEERLSGQEVSLMAFTDGETIIPMLPAQDHKRLLDGDNGPNTGGMGAYAPAPIFTADLMHEAVESILKPAVDGLRNENIPFVGVLYAGLMLTQNGIYALEFNCRFGDPETQAVLPLLETDLLDIADACVDGKLKDANIRWKDGAAVCLVLASKGYPDKVESGKIVKFEALSANSVCFHAGTKFNSDEVITSGGRVFGLTFWARDINSAVKQVYANVGKVSFDGMQFRKDIAYRALKKSSYADSGVSIDAGNHAVDLMKDAVKSTYTPSVLSGLGSFGGLYDVSALKEFDKPVLVASTDGVGTKVKLAAYAGRYRGIGHDIVNHCINDILVQGARPLFFMDYFATSKLDPEITAEVVTGMAEACKESGVALLGGETAEMPGVYQPNEFDVAGTIVGVVERDAILPRNNLQVSDVLIGLVSSGPHTNGYSLIRKVFADTQLDPALADALLAPHRSYYSALQPVLAHVKALAHITGGGFIENIPRVLTENLDAQIYLTSWTPPTIWKLIQSEGHIATDEMYRVFNMGIGMIIIADKSEVVKIQNLIPEQTFIIGELVNGEKKVRLIP